MKVSDIDKFAARVALADDGCLVWTGGSFKKGYGSFYLRGTYHRAHRWLWIFMNGDPGELQVEHSCRNRLCVHPEHLRLASNKENAENRSVRKGNASGYRGVSWIPRLQKWCARYGHNGRDVWVGTFWDKEDAVAAVKEARNRDFTYNEEDRKAS